MNLNKLILKSILVAALLLSLALAQAPAVAAATHYVPQTGDYFSYYEVIDLGNGTGNYAGYTEHTVVNGVIEITGVNGDGNVSAYYSYSWDWSSSGGDTDSGGSSGNFTFSSSTFLYVNGTDDQEGYIDPTVWFYIDNSTPSGNFLLLNTEMTLMDSNHSYYLPSREGYVRTTYAQGTSTYARNDEYGQFNAEGTWDAYFDPLTGYIVGYRYVEQDTGSGEGFEYIENLFITNSSYPLTAASAPSDGGDGSNLMGFFIFIVAIALVIGVAIILVLAILLRRSRRSLPKHPTQQVSWKDWEDQARLRRDSRYGPPPPPPPDLTPKQPPVQQIVVKEVAKVYCRYCGALYDSTAEVCPRCGGPRG